MEELLRGELSKYRPADIVRWEDPLVYAQYLAQTYYYVCHSTRLLGLAAARLGVDQEKLHQRMFKHASEERSHHLLTKHDLQALGHRLEDLPELASTAALYQTQYFQIEYVSPLTLFGYILALEGVAVIHGPSVYQRVHKAHGSAAGAFLKLHAEEDPDHLEKALEVVRSIPERDQAAVRQNLRFSCQHYRAFLEAVDGSSVRAATTAA
jgi:pyrroloquinoline quinone (PQQ) biosynthesis protein C